MYRTHIFPFRSHFGLKHHREQPCAPPSENCSWRRLASTLSSKSTGAASWCAIATRSRRTCARSSTWPRPISCTPKAPRREKGSSPWSSWRAPTLVSRFAATSTTKRRSVWRMESACMSMMHPPLYQPCRGPARQGSVSYEHCSKHDLCHFIRSRPVPII